MARLSLEVEAAGVKRGTDQAKVSLDGVKKSADLTERSLDKLGKNGAKDMQALTAASKKAESAQEQLAAAAARTGAAKGRFAGQVQNASFQIGDFATQVGAGTSATVALGQQLPQLLGGMGVLGAAMGAVVAIGVPLAAALIDVGGAAAVSEEDISDLTDAMDKAASAAEAAGVSFTAFSSSLNGDLGAIQLLSAADELEDVTNRFRQSLETNLVGILSGGLFGQAGDQVETLADRLDLSRREADNLLTSLALMEHANGPQEQADAARDLVEQFIAARGGVENLTAAQRAFLIPIIETENIAGEIAAIFEGYGGQLDAAAIEAAELASMLSTAAVQAERAKRAMAAAGSGAALSSDEARFGVLDARPDPIVDVITPEQNKRAAGIDLTPAKKARTGGGGASAADKAAKELDKLEQSYERLRGQLDPVFRAQTQYNDAIETAQQALAQGVITQDQYNETLRLAKERLDEATNGMSGFAAEMDRLEEMQSMDTLVTGAAKGLQSALSQFLFDPFEGGVKGMINQFSNALRQMAADAIAAQITQAIFGAISGGAGGGSVPFMDAGGYLPSGQTAIVGERRSEVVDRPTAIKGPAQITGGAQTARMDSGKAPQVNVASILALNMQQVVEAVTAHPMFETRVTEVNLVNG